MVMSPLASTTYELLCAAAASHGDRPAITLYPHGDPDLGAERVSYADLLCRINRAARAFRCASGARPPVVSYLLPTLIETHVTLWGAQAAGIVNPVNPLLNADQIRKILNAVGTTVLVYAGEALMPGLGGRIAQILDQVPTLQAVVVAGGDGLAGGVPFDRFIAGEAARPLDAAECGNSGIAAYFHTGGTTGAPKVARITHDNLVHAATAAADLLGFRASDVIMNPLPLFHIGGTVIGTLAPLSVGAHIVHPAPNGLRDPRARLAFWRQCAAERATIVGMVPTMATGLLEVPTEGHDLSHVRCALSGAAAMPVETARRMEALLGVPLLETYGMTETAGLIACSAVAEGRRIGSVGRAPAALRIEIRELNGRDVAVTACPPGKAGMVVVRGPNVFPGYLDHAHDSDVFTADGWLMTGDLGRLDEDGWLWLTGRSKDVIIRSGHNIDPSAIEEAAIQHPAVEACAAVGEPDPYAGEVPVLFVKPRAGHSLDVQELHAFVAARIFERPAMPRHIHVVPELPMTAVGKLFRPRLRAMAARMALHHRLAESGMRCPEALFDVDVRDDGSLDLRIETGEAVIATALRAAAQDLNISCGASA